MHGGLDNYAIYARLALAKRGVNDETSICVTVSWPTSLFALSSPASGLCSRSNASVRTRGLGPGRRLSPSRAGVKMVGRLPPLPRRLYYKGRVLFSIICRLHLGSLSDSEKSGCHPSGCKSLMAPALSGTPERTRFDKTGALCRRDPG